MDRPIQHRAAVSAPSCAIGSLDNVHRMNENKRIRARYLFTFSLESCKYINIRRLMKPWLIIRYGPEDGTRRHEEKP